MNRKYLLNKYQTYRKKKENGHRNSHIHSKMTTIVICSNFVQPMMMMTMINHNEFFFDRQFDMVHSV